MRAFAVLAVLAALLAPALAPSVAADTPLLDETVLSGPFWMAYRVHIAQAGTTASFDIQPSYEAAAAVAGAAFTLATDGTFLGGASALAVVDNTEVHVQVAGAPPVAPLPVFAFSGGQDGPRMTWEGASALAVGDYWFLLLNTNPGLVVTRAHLRGSAGVSLLAKANGDGLGFWRETDFDGDMNVHARVGAASIAPVAQVARIDHGHVAASATHAMLAYFHSEGAEPNEVSYATPSGAVVAGATDYFVAATAPGAYDFRADHWEATSVGGPAATIALMAADVELP